MIWKSENDKASIELTKEEESILISGQSIEKKIRNNETLVLQIKTDEDAMERLRNMDRLLGYGDW